MIGQILPNNNERCYINFSHTFREVNTPSMLLAEQAVAACSGALRGQCSSWRGRWLQTWRAGHTARVEHWGRPQVVGRWSHSWRRQPDERRSQHVVHCSTTQPARLPMPPPADPGPSDPGRLPGLCQQCTSLHTRFRLCLVEKVWVKSYCSTFRCYLVKFVQL
jgi:hypothetical protein